MRTNSLQERYMESENDHIRPSFRARNSAIKHDIQSSVNDELRTTLPLRNEIIRISVIFFCAVSLLVIGSGISNHNSQIIQQTFNYDDSCKIPLGQFNSTCTFNVTISKAMPKPIHVYYGLTNFWQNHRTWAKSVSAYQLSGDYVDFTESCEDMNFGEGGKTLYPCGLQGWSYFNDEIVLDVHRGAQKVCSSCLNSADIALQADKDRFKELDVETLYPNVYTSTVDELMVGNSHIRGRTTIPSLDDESLMVWMRHATGPSFHKIHSRINENLNEGDILKFSITNKFNINLLNGEKKLTLSTTNSSYGGYNAFLSNAFIISGAISLAIFLFIICVHAFISIKNGNPIY